MSLHSPLPIAALLAGVVLTFLTVPLLVNGQAAKDATDGTNEHSMAISHPDIYPDSEEAVVGELTVYFSENAKEADIYFTLDGSEPSKANPQAARYTVPLHFFTPGTVWVKARAVPGPFINDGFHIQSLVVEKRYTIKEAKYAAPTASPSGGFYRGAVTVEATTQDREVKLHYIWRDVMKQGDVQVTKEDHWHEYDGPIESRKVGKHFLFLKSVSKSNPDEHSPVARFTYTITSPLLYDVSTECEKCEGKLTANEIFTVSVQNARPDSWMFLSYSSRCEYKTQVQGTARASVDRHLPANRFRVLEESPAVFVCVEEGGAAVPVLRRGAAASESFFVINKGFRQLSQDQQKQAIQDAKDEDVDNGMGGKRSGPKIIKTTSSGSSFSLFLTVLAVIGAVGYMVRAARNNPSHSNGAKGAMSSVHRAVVSDVQRLVGNDGEPQGNRTEAV